MTLPGAADDDDCGRADGSRSITQAYITAPVWPWSMVPIVSLRTQTTAVSVECWMIRRPTIGRPQHRQYDYVEQRGQQIWHQRPSSQLWKLVNVAIANASQLEAARSTPLTPALSRFNYDAMPSLKSLNLSNCRIMGFLLLIHWTFDPVTLTFDLWSWTFALYRLRRDETLCLYQIWTQSSNTRRSYCDFNI